MVSGAWTAEGKREIIGQWIEEDELINKTVCFECLG